MDFANDQAEAFAAFAKFRNGGRNKGYYLSSPRQYTNFTTPADDTVQLESSRDSTRQLWTDVAKRFSHENAKFSGGSTECWPKIVESYTTMLVETELAKEWKRKFFHHLLRYHALEFYDDNVEHACTTYKNFWNAWIRSFVQIRKWKQ